MRVSEKSSIVILALDLGAGMGHFPLHRRGAKRSAGWFQGVEIAAARHYLSAPR
jgi:hypothetical protein